MASESGGLRQIAKSTPRNHFCCTVEQSSTTRLLLLTQNLLTALLLEVRLQDEDLQDCNTKNTVIYWRAKSREAF